MDKLQHLRDQTQHLRDNPVAKSKSPREKWAESRYTYLWLPKSMFNALSQFNQATMIEALQDKDNDCIVGMVLGDIASRALKGHTMSEDELKMLSLPRTLLEAATKES